jgi:hypothetical protein
MWSSVCTSLLWPPHSCCRWPVVVDLTTLGVLVCAPAIVHNPIFSLFLSVPCARTHCFMVPRPPFLHNIYSSPEFPVSNFYSLHTQQTRRRFTKKRTESTGRYIKIPRQVIGARVRTLLCLVQFART